MLKAVSSISNAIGALNYQGTWNANTNTPTLASGVGTKGDYYVVGTAGATTLDGISNWGIGDWAVFNGSVWQRVEGGADLNGVNLTASGSVIFSALTGYLKGNGSSQLTASSTIPSTDVTGLGTMSTQAANNVAITGGSVNGTTIGASTASSAKFTTLDASSPVVFKNTGNIGAATLQLFSGASSTTNSATFPGTGSVNGVDGTPNGNGLMLLWRDSGNVRSLSAAGSLNANGTDYAEYMTKSGNFTVAKGDVIGIDANGKITNKFSNAVSFAIKSTEPCMVGGDAWFTEQAPVAPEEVDEDATQDEVAAYQAAMAAYETALSGWKSRMEEARKHVDRIAFCGQVPVNLTGASPGDFVLPVQADNDGITAVAIKSPTLEQYMMTIGKVIAIEQDGRARVIVKIS